MGLQLCQLCEIAYFVTDKIPLENVLLTDYVTTDSLLPNKEGRCVAQNLPPQKCALTHYKCGDVLVANIRPYLKKIWFADREGGASADVLVFRAKSGHSQEFLYASLLQDTFYDYVMKGKKGSKMPRGDRDQIMRYSIPKLSLAEEACIGNMILSFCTKINVSRRINDNLRLRLGIAQTAFGSALGLLVNYHLSSQNCFKDSTNLSSISPILSQNSA